MSTKHSHLRVAFVFCGDAVQCLRTVRGDLKSTNIFLDITSARNICARAGASYERQRITSGRQLRPSPPFKT